MATKWIFETVISLILLHVFVGTNGQCPTDFSPLPYEFSCDSFYNCSTGVKILENCPTGTFYNCMNQSCGSRTFDFCCPALDTSIYLGKNGVNYPCLNGSVTWDYKYLDRYHVCLDGAEILTGFCEPGYLYCEASKSCYLKDSEACTPEVNQNTLESSLVSNGFWLSQAPWVICPNDSSNFNDPNDCTVYYNCSSGAPNLYKCPEGNIYDCFNDGCSTYTNWYCCNLDRNVKSTLLMHTNMYLCKNRKNTYLDGYANIFLECKDNNILTGDCADLMYCNTTKSCYDPNTTNCTKTVISSSSSTSSTTHTTTATTTTTTNASVGNYCFKSQSAIGVSTNCAQYTYFYNTSTSRTFSCPTPLLFNSFKKCCLPLTQIYTPACNRASNKPTTSDNTCLSPGKNVEDLESCNSYYTCNSAYQIVAQICPSGLLFDWKLASCTSAFSASLVPGCTTTKYNQCLNNNNLRGTLCNAITWIPRLFFGNLGKYCKSVFCRITWFN